MNRSGSHRLCALECGAVFEVWGFAEDTVTVPTWRRSCRFTRRDITLPINSTKTNINNNRSHALLFLLSLFSSNSRSYSLTIVRFQENDSAKGSLLSLLSSRGTFRFSFDFVEFRPINACLDPTNVRLVSYFEGVSQLKEKWTEYNQPKRLRRLVSLFVSATAKHVAVASGNRITILSKEDDYQNPCAIFTSEI